MIRLCKRGSGREPARLQVSLRSRPKEHGGEKDGERGVRFLAHPYSRPDLCNVVRPFVVEPLYIPSESRFTTREPGDHVTVAKFAYRIGGPNRGALAVFEDPEDCGEALIKHVVGLSGDTVEVRDGVLYVNGERRKEGYVNYRLTDNVFFGPVKVPAGRVLVMGDNRSNSQGSREFGPVSEADLLGKVLVRFWPLEQVVTS